MYGEVETQFLLFGLLLHTQLPNSSEQHTRADLEFSSDFGKIMDQGHTLAKCVLIIQLENPQIAHNSFGLSAQIVQLFGIFEKKNSHHMFIFHVHDVGQQVPREMQKMGCISIVSSFVYMVYCNTAGKQKRIMFRKLSSPFFVLFAVLTK